MKKTLFEKIMMLSNWMWIALIFVYIITGWDHPWMNAPLRYYITGGMMLPLVTSFAVRFYKSKSKEFLYGFVSMMFIAAGIFGPIAYTLIVICPFMLSLSVSTVEAMRKLLMNAVTGGLIAVLFLVVFRKINNKLGVNKEAMQFKEGWRSANKAIIDSTAVLGAGAVISLIFFAFMLFR